MRLMLILQCILGLQSQSIDFTNVFDQEYITSGDPVFIGLIRYFKSDGGQCGVVIRLKKCIKVQAKYARLWYENLQNGLLEPGFATSRMD